MGDMRVSRDVMTMTSSGDMMTILMKKDILSEDVTQNKGRLKKL